MKKEITQEDYNNMKEARDYFMEKYNNLKTLNMNTTTTDKQKIKKIADIITDNFNEQITDLLTKRCISLMIRGSMAKGGRPGLGARGGGGPGPINQ